MSNRIQKVNSLIKEQCGLLIQRELSLKPTVFVTIANVDTSADLRQTIVSLSVFPEKEKEYVMKTIEKERGRMQKLLHKKLHMKILPKLEFKYDDTEVEADKIEKILYDEGL